MECSGAPFFISYSFVSLHLHRVFSHSLFYVIIPTIYIYVRMRTRELN